MKHLVLVVLLLTLAFMAYPSHAEWNSTHLGYPAIETIVSSSNGDRLLIASSYGGLFLSENAGGSWEEISERVADNITSFEGVRAADPAADTLIAWGRVGSRGATNGWQIFWSTDGGQIWTQPEWSGGPRYNLEAIYTNPWKRDQWVIADNSSIQFTTDRGATWTPVDFSQQLDWIMKVVFAPDLDGSFYVVSPRMDNENGTEHGGVYLVSEDGQSETQVFSWSDTGQEADIAYVSTLTSFSDGSLMLLVGTETDLMIFTSSDGGESWQQDPWTLPIWPYDPDIVEVDEPAPHAYMISRFGNGLYTSSDGGRTWQSGESDLPDEPARTYALYRNPWQETMLFGASPFGLLQSDVTGSTWASVPVPDIGEAVDYRFGATLLPGGVSFNSYYTSYWAQGASTDFEEVVPPFVDDDSTQVVMTACYAEDATRMHVVQRKDTEQTIVNYYLAITEDAGESWTYRPIQLPDSMTYISKMHATTSNGHLRLTGYAWLSDFAVVSNDTGRTWQRPVDQQWYVEQSWSQGDTVVLLRDSALNGSLMLSEDGGATFVELSPMPTDNTLYFHLKPQFVSEGILFYMYSGMWLYTDAGTWRRIDVANTLHSADITAIPTASGSLVLSGSTNDRTLYSLSLDDPEWRAVEYELPWNDGGAGVYAVDYDPWRERLWVSTGNGLAWMDYAETSADGPWVFHPVDHVLLDAYPNPFNAASTVQYTIPRTGDVHLALFDILGREVMTLEEGMVQAGRHSLSLDASTLASGTYFLRLDAAQQQVAKRVTLVK